MEMNKKIEEVVAKAGVAILQDDDALIVDDEWTPEREALAQELLSQDKKVVPPFWQEKYEREAAKSWDLFYKRNTTNFYKDRHYLHLVFPGLAPKENETSTEPEWLLEVGCGVGNAALPLLEINPRLNVVAIDFAPKAVDLFKEQPLFDPARCHVSVCDITKDALPSVIDEAGGVNFALFMFCLSALRPDKMRDAVAKIASAVRPGGKIFFRDYGRYDQAQLRFKPGHKLADNFYVRQDNTRAYYFTTDEVKELFEAAGLVERENEYIRRQYANRSQNVVRFRVWIHAVFEKPMAA
ncbi:methyltransferase domain-containing protein [Achlya hypogyna]|uniref:tRNA N(3)-methylcytidine methyltransferase n=1 Tax=Achlya hypogyna TaxID=1202772 RepID=A0A1V9ZGM9_ACHHY|nr:methyltransferase domain-containing protein [Achlya hypogyna]